MNRTGSVPNRNAAVDLNRSAHGGRGAATGGSAIPGGYRLQAGLPRARFRLEPAGPERAVVGSESAPVVGELDPRRSRE